MTSDKEREYLTSLVISIMMKTGERIGNDDSASHGHFGVTGFQKKHITIIGDKVHLDYVGKSGVEHKKSFTDKTIARALKKAIKKSPTKYVFCTSDGFKIKADRINKYLHEYKITGKDLRGFVANKGIIKKLEAITIPEDEKQRKRIFNTAVKKTAGEVGHGASTLKKHYMIPELMDEYVLHGRIIDMKKLGYYDKGGEVEGQDAPKETNEKKYFHIGQDKTIATVFVPATSYFFNPHVIPEPVKIASEKLVDKSNNTGIDIHDIYRKFPVKEIPFSLIVPMQDDLNAKNLEQFIASKNDTFPNPFVLEYDGKYYLNDGHHRAVANYLNEKPILAHVYEIGKKMVEGGIGDNPEKISNFTQNTTKDEIENVLSGTRKVINGEPIQTASLYLRRNEGASSSTTDPKRLKHEQEAVLRNYDNLIPISDFKNQIGEGTEHRVYRHDDKTVVKLNSGYFYNSWKDYFNSLLLHNYFFPSTAYQLIGFTEENGKLYSVVRQPFIEQTEATDLGKVTNFLSGNGFKNTRFEDYSNEDLGVILADLHGQNVIINNGLLYFIDTIFYLPSNTNIKLHAGGAPVKINSFSEYLEANHPALNNRVLNEEITEELKAELNNAHTSYTNNY